MKKILILGTTSLALLALSSCACNNCAGRGWEIALEDGVHPYTDRQYQANEQIPCRKCGGKGTRGGGGARAGQFSYTKTLGTGMYRSGIIVR